MARPSSTQSQKTTRKKVTPTQTPASVAAPANGNDRSPSNGETLRGLYASLLRLRLGQEHARAAVAAGEPLPPHAYEAAIAAALFELGAQDTIVTAAHNASAGAVAQAPWKLLLPAEGGCTCAAGTKSAEPVNVATGIAVMHKLENKQNIVIAFTAGQASALESWRDAFHLAAGQRLPIIYAMHSTSSGETDAAAAGPDGSTILSKGHWMPTIVADACDLVALWRVAQESFLRARSGAGPTLVDCRLESPQDPLARMERYLHQRKFWDDKWKRKLTDQTKAEF